MRKLTTQPVRVSARPRHRILYVEDNDDNWNVIEFRTGASYELLRAQNDREACDILRAAPELYVVLMDVELSGSKLNGIQLTKLIRGQLPREQQPFYATGIAPSDVPIIFVTAFAAAYPNAELVAAGANDVLPKPVDFTRLNLALTKLFVGRTLNRP